jgi:hypothetical protein
MECLYQGFHRVISLEIIPGFPCGFLRWVTLPKYQVFHALPSFVEATLGDTLNDPELLSLDLFRRRRFLASPGNP